MSYIDNNNKRQEPKAEECPPVTTPGEISPPHLPDLKPSPDTPTVRPNAKPEKQVQPTELPHTD